MTSIRELEVQLPATCVYQNSWLNTSDWNASASPSDFPCTISEPGTTIRISPMTKQFGGWNEAHFHSNLRLPLECPVEKGILVLFEGMAIHVQSFLILTSSHTQYLCLSHGQ
jgi:hypothetical protein